MANKKRTGSSKRSHIGEYSIAAATVLVAVATYIVKSDRASPVTVNLDGPVIVNADPAQEAEQDSTPAPVDPLPQRDPPPKDDPKPEVTPKTSTPPGDAEPNDSRTTAGSIDIPGAVNGRVGFESDREDWFRAVVPRDGTLTVSIQNTGAKSDEMARLGTTFANVGKRQIKLALCYPGTKARAQDTPVSKGEEIFIVLKGYKGRHAAKYLLELRID